MFDTLDRDQVIADLRRRLDASASPASGSAAGSVAASGPSAAVSGRSAGPAGSVAAGPAVLPVTGPLADLLPGGGLPRGGVVRIAAASSEGTAPSGGTSLLLTLLGSARPVGVDSESLAGRWTAVVGLPGLGLLCAAELGVDLDRLVLVPDPGSDVLQVISVLADGVEMIVVGTAGLDLPPARLRILRGRLRQHGAVVIAVGDWVGADLTLTAERSRWFGLEQGWGRLTERELTVTVSGRRIGGSSTATLRLTGERSGAVAVRRADESGRAVDARTDAEIIHATA